METVAAFSRFIRFLVIATQAYRIGTEIRIPTRTCLHFKLWKFVPQFALRIDESQLPRRWLLRHPYNALSSPLVI